MSYGGADILDDAGFARHVCRRIENSEIGNPSRLVVFGFELALVEVTLRQAFGPIVRTCPPASEILSLEVKAGERRKKVFPDFPSDLLASTF